MRLGVLLQKWFLMEVMPGVTVEAHIDLSGGGQPQEFFHFAWFELSDLLPLTFPWKRAVYAHILQEFRPVIARLRAQHLLAQTGTGMSMWLAHVSPEEAVDAVVHKFGMEFVLGRVAAASQAHYAHTTAVDANDADAAVKSRDVHDNSSLDAAV
jgi:hypothetical protein